MELEVRKANGEYAVETFHSLKDMKIYTLQSTTPYKLEDVALRVTMGHGCIVQQKLSTDLRTLCTQLDITPINYERLIKVLDMLTERLIFSNCVDTMHTAVDGCFLGPEEVTKGFCKHGHLTYTKLLDEILYITGGKQC